MQSYHSVTRVSASHLLVWTTADDYICGMCGRVIQSIAPVRYAIVDGMNVRDGRVHNYPPRWNAAPSQELLIIRRNHQTGDVTLDPLRWGLIPYWCNDPTGGRKPINAKCETVRDQPQPIEQKTIDQPQIEASKPLPRIADRRFRRM